MAGSGQFGQTPENYRAHLANFYSATMPRRALDDIHLSDGHEIPKGAYVMVAPPNMHNPDIYPEPLKFDGYRFLRLREAPDAENKYQSVTTSPEHTAFGHGQHACPGRFFATNEIKLLFIYLLLHYDVKVPEGQELLPYVNSGHFVNPDPRQKLAFRSRTPELEWTALIEPEAEKA